MEYRSISPQVLRIFAPDEAEPNMDGATLSAWYRDYYRPVILEAERRISAATLAMYEQAIEYWEECGTAGKPLSQLTKADLAAFDVALRSHVWRRGPLGKERQLSEASVHKQLKLVLQITRAAFEEGHLPKLLRYSPRSPHYDRKPAYSHEECQAIWRVLDQAKCPTECTDRKQFWRLLLSLAFYTGVRIGAALGVRREMVTTRKGQPWLVIPGSTNRKTHKEWEGPLHPQVVRVMAATEGDFFPPPWRVDTLGKELKRLAAVAGVPVMGFHAWRRTAAEQLGLLGLGDAMELARQNLQHSSAVTTRKSYFDARAQAILLLPWLDD